VCALDVLVGARAPCVVMSTEKFDGVESIVAESVRVESVSAASVFEVVKSSRREDLYGGRLKWVGEEAGRTHGFRDEVGVREEIEIWSCVAARLAFPVVARE
jgi:hypothetical protein